MQNTLSSPDTISIRPETNTDYLGIDDLVVTAFGRPGIAPFVRAIRESEQYAPEFALVAVDGDQIVGQVMLSYVFLEDGENRYKVLTLSPLSVEPSYQGRGIGSRLVMEVLDLADKQGEPLVVLEGSPKFYPRFGFVPAYTLDITYHLSKPEAPPEAGMAKPLTNFEPHLKGTVVYPPAFEFTKH